MTLTLRITNMTTLPDGGAVEFSCTHGRFEIGRDPGMDWTLPDPNRFVSSCHAEVRWENGAYWLYDVSTNGTFVNGASMRVKSPYQIQNGDKLQFGHYVIEAVMGAGAQAGQVSPPVMAPPVSDSGPFGAPAGNAFGAAAPGGPFGAQPAGADPFGADPFGSASYDSGSQGSGAATPFGAQDDPWAMPGVAAADSDPFGVDIGPPSMGDAGNEMIPMDFGGTDTSGAALGSGPDASPFGAPAQAAGGFGAAPAAAHPPQAPAGSDSPFGAAPAVPQHVSAPQQPPAAHHSHPQAGDSSPFGAPPPGPGPAAPFGAGAPSRAAPYPVQSPPSEGFTPPAGSAPIPPPPAQQTPPRGGGGGDAAILRAICEGAGMRPDAMAGMDPAAAGYEIGQALRIVAAELAALLRVRSEGKQRYERSSRTMIGREANNPLKFIPTANEALEVMFGQPRQGYLRGPQTMQSSFDDIKRHQYAIQAALQPALARLLEDLSPEAIEDKVGQSRFGSRSARAWDLFVERWDAKTHPYENGMLDVFQAYYSDAYHDASKGG